MSSEANNLIFAATAWRRNSDLIWDCARLGYLDYDLTTLDPTYGKGNWWKAWCPRTLVTHDIRKDGVDFRDLPYTDNHFGQVAFDPPYVCVGGRKTSGIPEMHDAYGLTEAPKSPHELQQLINGGLVEMERVLVPGGTLLVKCQDYISSGKLWLGTHHTLGFALSIGLDCFDRLEHIAGPRPQPAGRRQVHARRNLSTLFVFKKQSGKPK